MAQAAPPAPLPAVGIGSTLDADDDCGTAANPCLDFSSAAVSATASSPNNIFQNQFWWFGPANPNSPTNPVFTFTPLSLVPGFLKPAYSWFTQNLNFEACVFGASVKVGPYGTTTFSVGRGCN
ncbi:hypothetical protein [Mycobacterium sp. C31M]